MSLDPSAVRYFAHNSETSSVVARPAAIQRIALTGATAMITNAQLTPATATPPNEYTTVTTGSPVSTATTSVTPGSPNETPKHNRSRRRTRRLGHNGFLIHGIAPAAIRTLD